MSTMNRMANCHNRYQGSDLKVLCVCSAGLLRSPTMARVLHRDYEEVNARAVGFSHEYALIPLEDVHLEWADIILSANYDAWEAVDSILANSEYLNIKTHINMEIPDNFGFGDPKLEAIIRGKLDKIQQFKDLAQAE